MLVNRKPLFVPESVHELQALPCIVLRVSRLGKCIAPRFASRYYDAVAPGVDFFAADRLREAKVSGKPWTEAVAFENSLAIGDWQPADEGTMAHAQWQLTRSGQTNRLAEWMPADLREQTDNAIARASELLTIRQGDLIVIAANSQPWTMQNNDVIQCLCGDNETLYCKIK